MLSLPIHYLEIDISLNKNDKYAQCWYVTAWSLSPVHVNANCSETTQKGHSWYVHEEMLWIRFWIGSK